MAEVIFLYGPPGAGKSTIGRLLAESLARPFDDLDILVEEGAGKPIAQIFAEEGEAVFRRLEAETLGRLLEGNPGVIALGGGALLSAPLRQQVEQRGRVLLLSASSDQLLRRLMGGGRPLLDGDPAARLQSLLAQRADHYQSFGDPLLTDIFDPSAAVFEAQRRLGFFHLRAMGRGYDLRVSEGALDTLPRELAQRALRGPLMLVSDSNTGPLYARRVLAALTSAGCVASHFSFPAGEASKNLATAGELWAALLAAGIERRGTLLALGGGVVGDLAGFAAATYLRGVNWVNLPSSLLAMVDAGLGGKTAIDLPQGKNLVGAFYPPRLVLADPDLLTTLPENEFSAGMAEVVKHAVIGDGELLSWCAQGLVSARERAGALVSRAAAVKVRVIEQDPYEGGLRQALNFGHTLGHALEHVSRYAYSHGEAVAIGMVAETRLAERLGIAERGLAEHLAEVLAALQLPVSIPAGIERADLLAAMAHDKKRTAGEIHFSLPRRVGEVETGIVVEDLPAMLLEE